MEIRRGVVAIVLPLQRVAPPVIPVGAEALECVFAPSPSHAALAPFTGDLSAVDRFLLRACLEFPGRNTIGSVGPRLYRQFVRRGLACQASVVTGQRNVGSAGECLVVHAIGQGLAQALGKLSKHGVKQVGLSNQGIDVWEFFGYCRI